MRTMLVIDRYVLHIIIFSQFFRYVEYAIFNKATVCTFKQDKINRIM